jgi:hypothetical protein
LFNGVKELHIDYGLQWELSRALQADEVGSDPGFYPIYRLLRQKPICLPHLLILVKSWVAPSGFRAPPCSCRGRGRNS